MEQRNKVELTLSTYQKDEEKISDYRFKEETKVELGSKISDDQLYSDISDGEFESEVEDNNVMISSDPFVDPDSFFNLFYISTDECLEESVVEKVKDDTMINYDKLFVDPNSVFNLFSMDLEDDEQNYEDYDYDEHYEDYDSDEYPLEEVTMNGKIYYV